MKRLWIPYLTILALACGCGSTENQAVQQEEDKPTTEHLIVSSLPYPDLHYNDKVLKIKDITLYQAHDDEKFLYHPYCIVRFDASDMTEEDLHYLGEGDISQSRYAYLNVDCEYTSPSNEIEDDDMDSITHYIDGSDVVYTFYDYSQSFAQHSLEDMYVEVDIDIIQSGGKIIKMYEEMPKNFYDIKINGDSDIKIEVKDDSQIPESENNMMEKGFASIINRGF